MSDDLPTQPVGESAAGSAATGPATGEPAAGSLPESPAHEPLGRTGLHHWRQATITDPTLDERGNVFFAAVEMTRMPMVLADPNRDDCPIVFANNAFLDLTGYEEHEVVGRNCRFLQGANTDRETVDQLRRGVERREAVSIEILNYRRDGSAFWNAVFMGPVFGPDGRLLYFFASQLDVSRRREADQQFRQAQKMEAIGQLTAGLAHDFNNLLHVITASLERIGAKRGDARTLDRYLAAASSAAERGAKLTHQLLAFARRGRLEPRGIDLSRLVNDVADLLESSVGERARLHLSLQRRLPPVKVDTNHLEMALINLVVNARDASENGGAITVTTRDRREAGATGPGGDVELCVSDEGSGMSPEVAARATEPFFTTKPRGQGTGLGLAMAHGFVQQSGGRLEIESAPGAGTHVRMIFPRHVPGDGSGDGSGAEGDADGEATGADGRAGYRVRPIEAGVAPSHLLVVDDNREAAGLAAEILEEVGYRVAVAHSAEEALACFEAVLEAGDPFRLVFSDVIMPGGASGLDLAEWVRARAPETPVLLTTGYNDEMALNGPQPQAMDVLGKPFRRGELIERVQAALRNGARTAPGRRTSDFGVARA